MQTSIKDRLLLFFLLISLLVPVENHPYKNPSKSVIDSSTNSIVIISLALIRYFNVVQRIFSFSSPTLSVMQHWKQTFVSLTKPGQIWAMAMQKCLMQELDYFFKTNPTLTCSEIDRYVLSKYPICLSQSHPVHSLCSIVCNNLLIFFEIFENWTLKSVNLRRLLLESSHLCPEQSQMEYVIDLERSSIRTMFWSLCLDSLKANLRNFHPNEIMTQINEKSGLFAEITEEQN